MKIVGRALVGAGAGLCVWFAISQVLGNAAAQVRVECAGSGIGFSCSLSHEGGGAKADACWDIVVLCQNGLRATAHGCGSVEPGAKSSVLIPIAQVNNAQSCDLAVNTSVTNLVVN